MHRQRRLDGLIVRQLGGEVVVYDLERHRAHSLNRAAGVVFMRCDGRTSAAELARTLRDEIEMPAGEASVRLAIDELDRAGLLERSGEISGGQGRVSRRRLLGRLGRAGAAAVPVVTSLVVPTTAQAAATCVLTCNGSPAGTRCGPLCDGICDGGGDCD